MKEYLINARTVQKHNFDISVSIKLIVKKIVFYFPNQLNIPSANYPCHIFFYSDRIGLRVTHQRCLVQAKHVLNINHWTKLERTIVKWQFIYLLLNSNVHYTELTNN